MTENRYSYLFHLQEEAKELSGSVLDQQLITEMQRAFRAWRDNPDDETKERFQKYRYAVSWTSYGIAYSIRNKGISIALTKGELAIIFLVAPLQVWSYCSVTNLVGIFCRNQSVTMIVGFGWMVMEILLRATLDIFGMEISATNMFPLTVLERSADYAVLGLIYDSSFWISGIYAVAFIAITCAVAYVWFSRTDVC